MKRSRLLGLFLLTVMVSGCTRPAGRKDYEKTIPPQPEPIAVERLSLATDMNLTSTALGKRLQAALEERPDGEAPKITISIYENQTLGDAADITAGIQKGTIPMAWLSARTQAMIVPEIEVLSIPGIFSNQSEVIQWLDTDYYQELEACYESRGLLLLGCYGIDMRILASNTPIQKLEDLQNLTIGICNNPYEQVFWEQFKVNTQIIDLGEVYSAVYKRAIDVFACTYEEYLDLGLQNTMRYLIPLNLGVESKVLLINREQFDGLTAEAQAEVRALARNLKDNLSGNDWQEYLDSVEASIEDSSTTILYPSFEFREAIINGRSRVLTSLQNSIGAERLNRFLDHMSQMNNY